MLVFPVAGLASDQLRRCSVHPVPVVLRPVVFVSGSYIRRRTACSSGIAAVQSVPTDWSAARWLDQVSLLVVLV